MRSRGAKRSADKPRKMRLLERLRPGEASEVLRRVLQTHPEIIDEAERTAKSVLGEVAFEAVALDVESAVRAPDQDDLAGRAGRHSWGYVEPTEAAWEILEGAVEPFIVDLKRQLDLGLEVEAIETLKGVVLGLYRARHGDKDAGRLLNWAPDFPAEAAGTALDAWCDDHARPKKPGAKAGAKNRPPFPEDFVDTFVPEWSGMISRILARKR